MNEGPYLSRLGDSKATIRVSQSKSPWAPKLRNQKADRHKDRKETLFGAEIIPGITCSHKTTHLV